jgi:sec-independent protein translocase protein TatA
MLGSRRKDEYQEVLHMPVAAGIGPFGPVELVVILLVLVMIFGASRLADLGGSLGKGIKEFKKNVQDDNDDEPTVAQSSNQTPAGGDSVAAVRCASCGTLNAVGSKHCSNCGAAIAATVS